MDDDSDSSLQTHTIPRIIHVATKTRCLPKNLRDAILNWKGALEKDGENFNGATQQQHKQQFSLVVHDEAAVDRLLAKYWLEFPQLQKLQNCIMHGRAKLNLWRLLVLWEYGGIFINWIDAVPSAVLPTLSKYVNVDNNSNNNNATTTIPPTDALLFFDPPNIHTNDNTTTIYSHVMAASPHHPFFHSAVLTVMSELLYMKEVGTGMDIIATGGRRTFSNMVRVFMRRNHNPQDKNTERYLEEYCVNHNNNNDDDGKTNVWTGIGQRQLTTLATISNNNNNDNTTLSSSPRARLGAAQFELSSKRDAVYPPPGQDHHDVCIQHMYKQDVKNHIGENKRMN